MTIDGGAGVICATASDTPHGRRASPRCVHGPCKRDQSLAEAGEGYQIPLRRPSMLWTGLPELAPELGARRECILPVPLLGPGWHRSMRPSRPSATAWSG